MKKSLVARGFIGAVASLLGVAAVGCGAATDQEAAEIGSTEQAIVSSDVAAGPDLSISGSARNLREHGACKVTVGGVDFLMTAGGIDATPATTKSVFVLKPGTGWFEFTNVLPTAIAKLQLIQNPRSGEADSCLAIGGVTSPTGTTAVNTVTKLTLSLSGGNPSAVAAASSGTMTARFDHRVIQCGTDKVLIAGGQSGANRLDTLEVWDNGSVATLKDSNNDPIVLTDPRAQFAIAQEDTTHIGIMGGFDGTNFLNGMEKIVVTSSCALTTNDADDKTDKLSSTLSVARSGLVAWRSATNTFHVAAGDTGSASNVDDVVSNFFASSSVSSGTTAVAAKSPALAFDPSSGHAFLVGGVGQNAIQEFDGSWTSVTTDSASATLPVRQGATATLIGSSVFAVAGGDGSNVAKNKVHTISPL